MSKKKKKKKKQNKKKANFLEITLIVTTILANIVTIITFIKTL
ncbi:hypothetical protein [Paraclostridium bifermentans]|nr:hypothetical protein [Paraclostridium bifermentans]